MSKCGAETEVYSRANEIWKSIPGFPRHEASSFGRIRVLPGIDEVRDARGWSYKRFRPGKMLTPNHDSRGYAYVSINDRTHIWHRLIASAFLGVAPSPNHQVNHKNGNKRDNRKVDEWEGACA